MSNLSRTSLRRAPFVFAGILLAALVQAQAPSSVTLTPSPSPANYSQPVTLSAAVTAGATGKVTFYDGTTVLGTSTITAGVATFETRLLASGTRSLRAYYLGNGSFHPSSSAVVQESVVAATSLGFKPTVSYAYGSPATVVAVGDFNGDGKLDCLLVDNELDILIGNGDGTFQSPVLISTDVPTAVATADFNEDGITDLVIASANGGTKVLLGKRDGTFQPPISLVGISSNGLAVADFDGDGNVDFATSTIEGVNIILGNGDGTFQAAKFGPAQCQLSAVADFDGDGIPDMVCGVSFTAGVTLLRGNGDGTFQATSIASARAEYITSIGAVDLNGDGKIDVVAGGQGVVFLLLGNGDGTFQEAQYAQDPAGGNITAIDSIGVGDFNGDGIDDIVFPLSDLAAGAVFGSRSGIYSRVTLVIPGSSLSVAVGDFNGDGRPDFIAANQLDLSVVLGGAMPDLSVALTRIAGFTEGQTGAFYRIAVTNVGQFSSSGVVEVVDTLSAGLTVTGIAGTGWTCVLATLACTRSDSLAMGASYPAITITLNVAANFNGNAANSVTVTGGGDSNPANNTATSIIPIRLKSAISVTSSPNPSGLGNTITMTASVTPSATGKVTFFDGGNPLGEAVLSAGQAVLSTDLLPSGGRSLTATYVGDSNYGPSVSAVHVQSVNAVLDNSLLPPSSIPVDAFPLGIASGDFNRDGTVDLVTVSNNTGNVSVLLGKGDGTFYPAIDYPFASSGSNATVAAVAVADLDQDGKPDLLVAASSGLFWLAGHGDGSFQAAVSITVASFSNVVIADVNQDGVPDLIATTSGNVSVFLGNGDGTFQDPVPNVIVPFTSASVADLNGDGIPDLVALNAPSGTDVVAYLGNPDGTFQSQRSSVIGVTPLMGFASGDFDGDGKIDVAVISFFNVAFMAGNGDGTFQPPSPNFAMANINPKEFLSSLTSNATTAVLTGDFNGDGKLDFVYAGNGLTLALGNGDGTFQNGATFNTGGYPQTFALADFNRDGMPDLAIANSGTGNVNLFMGGQSSGLSITTIHQPYYIPGQAGLAYGITISNPTFLTATAPVTVTDSLPTGLSAVAISGSACVLAALTCTYSALTPGTSLTETLTLDVQSGLFPSTLQNHIRVTSGLGASSLNDPVSVVDESSVLLNATGPALLVQATTMSATVTPGAAGKVLFLDGANPLGIATVSSGSAFLTSHLAPAGTRQLRASYGGDSTLSTSISQPIPVTVRAAPASGFGLPLPYTTGGASVAIAVGDFNNDGVEDLVTANGAAGTVSVLVGNGNGTFQPHADINVGTKPVWVAVGDFNGDGRSDLAVVNQTSNNVSILIGNGNGTFQTGATLMAGNGPSSLAVGDFNGDAKEDLAVMNSTDGTLSVFLGNGDGTFQTAKVSSVGQNTLVQVVDLNGDANADLLLSGSYNYALIGNGDGTFTGTYLGFEPIFAVGDLNGDGKTDIVSAQPGGVEVVLGNGNGTFGSGQFYALGISPTSLAIGDFNGDGKLDVIAASSNSTSIAILPGNGDGTLQPGISYSAGSAPSAIVVGEFNGDGRTDVALAESSANSATVLLGVLTPILTVSSKHGSDFYFNQTGATYTITVTNDGPGITSGTITVVDTMPSGLTATSIGGGGWSCTVATLTCTRSDPLGAATNFSAITITVNVSSNAPSPAVNMVSVSGGGSGPASGLDSTGIGVLAPPVLNAPGNGATGVAQIPTLSWTASAGATSYDVHLGTSPNPAVVGNTTSTSYSPVGLNQGATYYWQIAAKNGSGSGASAIWSFTTQPPAPLIPVADFNGDGKTDVFLYDATGGNGYVGLSNGTGTLNYVYSPFTPGFDIVRYGKFNGDAYTDLVVYNSTTALAYTLLSTGTGTFNGVSLFPGPGFKTFATGDLNGDGLTDFVIYRPSDGTSYTAISNGDGTFHYQYALVSIGFTNMVVADFNGDGKADVFYYRSSDGLSYLGISNGSGGFTFSPVTLGPGYAFVETGDMNGDGKADLLLYSSTSGETAVGLSTGSGFTFTPYSYSPGFTTVKVFDFNGDGKADVALYNKNNTLGYLGIGTGTGSFTFGSLFWGAGMDTVDALDLNGDGKVDVVIYNSTNGASCTGISSGNAANPFTYQYSYWGNGKLLASAAAQP